MTPSNVKTLAAQLDELAPGLVEIVRADHFFGLWNQAHGLAYNLCLRPDVVISGDTADLGGEYEVSRVRFTSTGVGFTLSVSCNGETWNEIESSPIDEEGYDFDIPPVRARYVKITGNAENIEIYGK